ncbi:MbnP family protein [Pedobacter rhizosphaerae]|nr:MbnP family protein [Pedobacter rhizosphaerae]
MMKKFLTIISLITLLFASCSKEEIVPETELKQAAGTLSLNFDAIYGSQDFALNKAFDYELTSSSGNAKFTYEFTKLRYWVSNVILVTKDGNEYKVPDSYYLIEENTAQPIQGGSFNKVYPANKRENVIIRDIPFGEYKTVKFSIGVDSRYNDNLTLRAGELSALTAMANDDWMWFTSYIFTSTAGKITWVKSAPEAAVSKNFTFETGSNAQFKQKTIELINPISIGGDYTSKIDLTVDAKKILDLEAPFTDNIIGATKPALMTRLTDNVISKAISFKSAEGIKK